MRRLSCRSVRESSRNCSFSTLEPRRLLANPVVVDVLAVFTPGAAAQIGSEALLRSRVQDSIDGANRVMSNSRIAVSLRLVHVDPVAYTGANNLFVDRTNLANGSGGLAAAQTLRNTYGADLVTLIVENNAGSGGNASLMTSLADPTNASTRAFIAVTPDALAPYNYTLAHELGHTLGAGHERGNTIDPAVGPFPYSYGYRFTGADGVVYHDIMSYDPGVEVPYYANPAVSVHGAPTGAPVGSANQADLAATFAQTAPVVSAYRAAVVPDVAPYVTLDTLRVKSGFAYVTVRYEDDSGIDLASVDSNDITLTVPGLPAITPVLDSIENPGVGGAFNRVTYRAYLREVPVDPLSIVVGMKASAVKDITGKFVPAVTTIPTNTRWTAGYGYSTARDLGAVAGAIEVGDALGDQDHDDVFKFSLASATTLGTRLTGLSQDANVFIARDSNGDGVYQSSEIIDGSYRTGATQDESVTLNLAAGTYFAWVYNNVTTPYKLQLSTYNDTVAPTAKLDATDITAPTNTFTFNVAYDDDVEVNAYTARYYSPVRITNPFGGYYISFATAIDVDVNGPHRLVTYQVNAGFTLSASDNGVYTVALEPNTPPIFNPPLPQYVGDGAKNFVVPGMLGTFRVAIGAAADNAAPTFARTDAPQVYRGGATSYDFDVTFADNVGITTASLNASQVTITGPDGVPRTATAINVTAAPAIGSRRVVHYRLASLPGGSWDYADYGTYTLALVAGVVKDAAGNTMGTTALGSFNVSVPLPGDANNNGTVEFGDLVILAQNYNLTGKTFAQGNFDDDPAGNVDFNDLVILAQRYNTSRVELAPLVEKDKTTKKRPSVPSSALV